ncbi:hypothetical protein BD410DRAFT_896348 [Rickenella mellea]|uniref:Uncharacterized protein n=1 Tax=Rickenella mellea TaxID=50990 RepID=A0A4Y7QCY8_9AGAM|nr:hypothetical protein BD410DRAFT_896348 [Rickenella mellea]
MTWPWDKVMASANSTKPPSSLPKEKEGRTPMNRRDSGTFSVKDVQIGKVQRSNSDVLVQHRRLICGITPKHCSLAHLPFPHPLYREVISGRYRGVIIVRIGKRCERTPMSGRELQTVFQLSNVVKTYDSTHRLSAQLREDIAKLTNATQEFLMFLHVSSFSPSSTPRPCSPMPNGTNSAAQANALNQIAAEEAKHGLLSANGDAGDGINTTVDITRHVASREVKAVPRSASASDVQDPASAADDGYANADRRGCS